MCSPLSCLTNWRSIICAELPKAACHARRQDLHRSAEKTQLIQMRILPNVQPYVLLDQLAFNYLRGTDKSCVSRAPPRPSSIRRKNATHSNEDTTECAALW